MARTSGATSLAPSARQEALQPAPALGQVETALPERPQRASQPQAEVDIAALARPGQRRAQVVVLALQLLQPCGLLCPGQRRRGHLGEPEIVGRVAPPDRL